MVAHMVWCLFACLNWITALLLLCEFVVTLGVSFENTIQKNGHANRMRGSESGDGTNYSGT